jgi:hypothetical protein
MSESPATGQFASNTPEPLPLDIPMPPAPVAANRPDKHPILQHFAYDHLPLHLQGVSREFKLLAHTMHDSLPMGAELIAGLRKLLEAKDCMVRAANEK